MKLGTAVFLLACAGATGCKGKSGKGGGGDEAAKGPPSAAVSLDAAQPVPVAPDAAVPPPVAADQPAMPSESLITVGLGPTLLAGPVHTVDGKGVVWCTRGDNGMADWRETICHVVEPGKKPVVIPVMTYADAMAVDEGIDPASDADAGPRAASARDRVMAAITKLGLGGATLTALPAPVRCSFADGEFTGRDDGAAPADPRADPAAADGCVVGGLTATINPQGKVTVVSGDKILFTEAFKPRDRGHGDGNACFLEATHVELAVDPASKLAAVAVWMTNPSDMCALVTEYEVRAFRF